MDRSAKLFLSVLPCLAASLQAGGVSDRLHFKWTSVPLGTHKRQRLIAGRNTQIFIKAFNAPEENSWVKLKKKKKNIKKAWAAAAEHRGNASRLMLSTEDEADERLSSFDLEMKNIIFSRYKKPHSKKGWPKMSKKCTFPHRKWLLF